jgi:hypothetical protein
MRHYFMSTKVACSAIGALLAHFCLIVAVLN